MKYKINYDAYSKGLSKGNIFSPSEISFGPKTDDIRSRLSTKVNRKIKNIGKYRGDSAKTWHTLEQGKI